MSHIYQPVMLRLLIENGGWAGLRDIAAAFLARDESQIGPRITLAPRVSRHGVRERGKVAGADPHRPPAAHLLLP